MALFIILKMNSTVPPFPCLTSSELTTNLILLQVRVAQEMGSSHRDGSLLLSYIAIGSGVGKIIFGKISDLPWVDTLSLYNCCMVLSGLSPLLAIYAKAYYMLVVYVVVLGLFDGCIIGLMSIVTFECTDHNKMSEAWGGVLMIQSFSMLIGAPAAGEKKLSNPLNLTKTRFSQVSVKKITQISFKTTRYCQR